MKNKALIKLQKKSYLINFFLTLFFGPFGLIYVSGIWALVFTLISAALLFFTFGFGALAIWPIVVITGLLLTYRYNIRLAKAYQTNHIYNE